VTVERRGAVGSRDYNGDNLGGNTRASALRKRDYSAGGGEAGAFLERRVSSSRMFRWRLRFHR